jgi:two-component system, sensor histidine kinase and response regulator
MSMDQLGEIMVVDDTSDSLRLMTDLLTAEGYKVRPTPDPQLALDSAFANPPDLILLDVKMPGMDGFEACQRLKQNESTSNVPVIFVSALQDMEDRVRGFEVGGLDFITKPIHREEVLARVSAQLELFRVRQHLEEQTQQLVEANLKLQDLDRLKSMFIATMTHEFRTPMNAIIGFTGIMLQEIPGKVNDTQKDYLTRVSRAGQHLSELISDVIDISKIEAGHLEVEPQHFNLKQVIDKAMEIIQPQAEIKHLALEVDATSWPEMYSDSKRFFQCVLNYLSNALKFTNEGKVTVVIREMDGHVKVAVRDTGIGIPEEDIPKLFQAFERLETSNPVKSPGTGLGLYLTRKIIKEVLQGTVEVESQVGKGSTFSLQIPKKMTEIQVEEKK